MTIPPEMAEQLLAESEEAAAALLADLADFRAVVAKPEPTPSDARHLAVILRRLLLQGNLGRVANPRVGRLTFDSWDLAEVKAHHQRQRIDFFFSGGAAFSGARLVGVSQAKEGGSLAPRIRGKVSGLTLESFLDQDVLCFENTWVSRRQLLTYAANVMHGAHSGDLERSTDDLLDRARHGLKITWNAADGIQRWSHNIFVSSRHRHIDPMAVDCVMLEVIATAKWVLASSTVQELEKVILAEVSLALLSRWAG